MAERMKFTDKIAWLCKALPHLALPYMAVLCTICTVGATSLYAGSDKMTQDIVEEEDIIEEADTARISMFERKLEEYISALEFETTRTKCLETDFLISTPTDPVLKTLAATRLFEHYSNSRLMGDEAVAVHIFDKWFDSKVIEPEDEAFMWTAKLFCTANRLSLIGNQAIALQLVGPEGEMTTVPERKKDEFQVLFFYDTGCPSCLAESIMLPSVLHNSPVPVSLAAIYIGSDAMAWERYRTEKLGESFNGINILHLWNPDNKEDLTTSYGVLGTPRIFLIGPDGTILGRRLTASALEKLLSACKLPETEYGSENSTEFYRKFFDKKDKLGSLDDAAGMIENLTLAMEKDTLMFKQMIGDLLYFAAGQREGYFKNGIKHLIDNRILSRPEIWTSEDDSLKVVGFASMLKDLACLSPIGGKLPEIKVRCSLSSHRKGNELFFKDKIIRLDKIKGPALIIFHTEGCNICKEDISAATDLTMERADIRLVLVNMDMMMEEMPEEASELMAAFDLSFLPYSTGIGKDRLVAWKYLSATDFGSGEFLDKKNGQ